MNRNQTIIIAILICFLSLSASAQVDITDRLEGVKEEAIESIIEATEQIQEQDYRTKQDILQTYGAPDYQGGYKEIELWYYPADNMFIFFDQGRVVKIDIMTRERN